MITRQTSLSRNIVQFCRFLRQKGFAVGVEEEATALDALLFIDYSKRDIFVLALKSVCCRNRRQLHDFDDLFEEYWKELNSAADAKTNTQEKTVLKPGSRDANFKSLKSWLNGNRHEGLEETAAYSIQESFLQKDFSAFPSDELDELMHSIKALSVRLARQLNRRYTKCGQQSRPDLRRTVRKNMRHGGELIEIVFRKPRRNRTRLLVLCDVSKSMDLYAGFLLQFIFAFQQVFKRVETFAFSTSLQHITALLKQQDFKSAAVLLGQHHHDWSGGTRIGECLHQFVQKHASHTLTKHTVVIILSDGWDTGNINLLEQSMETIHTGSKKIIWLNPVAGYAFYQPEAAGMQAAMPYIDVFAPVHNLDSLRKLGKWL